MSSIFAKESHPSSLIPHNLCGERKSVWLLVRNLPSFQWQLVGYSRPLVGGRTSCRGCSLRDTPSFRQKRPNLLLSPVWGGSLSREPRRSHTRETRFRSWKGRQGWTGYRKLLRYETRRGILFGFVYKRIKRRRKLIQWYANEILNLNSLESSLFGIFNFIWDLISFNT